MHYALELSCEPNDIGSEYPQIQKMKTGYDYEGSNSVYKLSKCYEVLPDFTPDLDAFVLHARAKRTDFLSNALTANGFIVSEKVKSILHNHILQLHAFYPAKILYRGKNIDNYYWFHLIYDLTDFIDYPASSFVILKNYSREIGDIQIFSKQDYQSKKNILKEQNPDQYISIWVKKVKLIGLIDYDFFEIANFDSHVYISEKLKNVFEQESVTGIVLKQLSRNLW